jgi:imidazolonepropionase-like amidohydrolase
VAAPFVSLCFLHRTRLNPLKPARLAALFAHLTSTVDHRTNYDNADAAAAAERRGDCAGRFCDDGRLPPRRGWGSDRTGFVLNRLGPPQDMPKPKRKRKPTLARALRDAAKAGVNVAGATIEDGRVSLTFGEAQAEQANDLDKWMAKRHAN